MQAVAQETKIKKSRLPLVMFIFLLLVAGGCAIVWLTIGKPFTPPAPEFSSMSVDAAGDNLVGNLDENLAAGGFMSGQNGWVYYANFEDNAALYMCREGGDGMVKLTDFPVANINIIGDSLVFTSLDQIFTANKGSVSKLDFVSASDLLSKLQTSSDVWYGGSLYAIYGINSAEKELRFALLEETAYFPQLDTNGLYISTGKSNIVNKLKNSSSRIGEPDEVAVKMFAQGGAIYAELRSATGSRIVRADAKNLQPLASVPGRNLSRLNGGFAFQDVNDGYIYQIDADGKQITPISAAGASDMRVTQNGDISARGLNGADMLISKRLYYIDIVSRVLAAVKRVTMQNGWYNYMHADPALTSRATYPGVFSANGKYFSLGAEGVWAQDGVVVEWMRIQPLDAVATRDMFEPESGFTPSWYGSDAQSGEDGDSGSEDAEDLPGSQPSATSDPRSALEAVIMMLRDDGSLDEKYTPESVAAMKAYYGGSIDRAVEKSADGFASVIGAKIGAAPNPETLVGIVSGWFKAAKYEVGEAEIDGDEAFVPLSVSGVVDSALLYPAIEAEIMNRATKNPMLLFKSPPEQASWALKVLLEIIGNPEAYNAVNFDSAENDVAMLYNPDVGWVLDNPEVLLYCFVRGM